MPSGAEAQGNGTAVSSQPLSGCVTLSLGSDLTVHQRDEQQWNARRHGPIRLLKRDFFTRGQKLKVKDPWHILSGYDLEFAGMSTRERVRVMLEWFGRSQSLWMLGYPKSALADAVQAMSYSRAIGHAVTLINTLCLSSLTNVFCGNYATARAELTEGIALSGERSAIFWKAQGTATLGVLSALMGSAADAVNMIDDGLAIWRSRKERRACRFTCHIWRRLMQCLADSMKLNATSIKRFRLWK